MGRNLMRHLLLLVAAVVLLAGCQEKYEWRQKMTVVVETPNGDVSGYSVVQIFATYNKPPSMVDAYGFKLIGESLTLEIMPDRFLVFVLSGDVGRMYRSAPDQFVGKRRNEWLAEIPAADFQVTVPTENLPVLVTFSDIQDPNTVTRVDPSNLAAVFGEGVVLKTVTLEITDEPITTGGITKLVDWLDGPMDALVSEVAIDFSEGRGSPLFAYFFVGR